MPLEPARAHQPAHQAVVWRVARRRRPDARHVRLGAGAAGAGNEAADRAAHVVLKALAADGTALFEGPVLPTGPLGPDAPTSRARAREFDAPPGNLRLRMSIEDEAEQAIDSDVRDIMVRDLVAPVVLGTPEVFRGRNRARFPRAGERPGRRAGLVARIQPDRTADDSRPRLCAGGRRPDGRRRGC